MGETNSSHKQSKLVAFFDGVKSEFKKIIWPEKMELVKQTVTVSVVSIVLGLLIALIDTMAKKVEGYIKLQIAAGKATPAPPVGPALGQHGVNIVEFTKQFNAKTADMGDTIVPVVITVYADRSFSFVTKTPPAAVLLKKACNIKSGSGAPNKTKVAKISKADLQKIAETKMPDLNAGSLEAAMSMIAGTARSMGITVED